MIISASRRTDVPAFYGDWFINRLKAGEVLVRNPMNTKQVTRIVLSPETVDCFVFWTKNPKSFIDYLPVINEFGYNYYFLFTLTAYDDTIERGVEKKKIIIETFKRLSGLIGPEKVIWRYDPIFVTEHFTFEYHYKWFEYLARILSGYTDKCIISFLSFYNKVRKNMTMLDEGVINMESVRFISARFSDISAQNNISLYTCCHDFDLTEYGICHAKCVDDEMVERMVGHKLNLKKDKSQREECGCVESRDIGIYNSCDHGCLYCYANQSAEKVRKNSVLYDPHSPMLCDKLRGDEKIIDYKERKNNKGESGQGLVFS